MSKGYVQAPLDNGMKLARILWHSSGREWLAQRLAGLVAWWLGWLLGCLVAWVPGWLLDGLVGRRIGFLVPWLVWFCLVSCFLTGLLSCLLAGWLAFLAWCHVGLDQMFGLAEFKSPYRGVVPFV